jgi:hypothetical protein
MGGGFLLSARIIATIAAVVGIAALPETSHMTGVLSAPAALAPWWGLLGHLRPAVSRGLMENKNVVVVSRLRWEEIRRAALKLDSKRYPAHASALAKREMELRAERRAA